MDALKRILELKENANITSAELCRLSGIPQTMMSKIEHKVRSVDLLIIEKICAALNITLKEFFDVENEESLNLNPEYIKLINTAKTLPEYKLKILNNVAEGFKETTYVNNNDTLKIKQKLDALDIPEEDLEKLLEYYKNKKER